MEKKLDKLPRLTFEEVLANQLTLREQIWELAKQNRCVASDDETEFTQIYYRATLGLGGSIYLASGRFNGPDQRTLDDVVLNLLCGWNYREVKVGLTHSTQQTNVPVAHIWQAVLIRLKESVFAEALQQAVKLSPEIQPRQPRSSGYPFRPQKEEI